jgi:flagellar basal body rod protein FlgG
MDPLLISAASGLKARIESLDLIANNLANTGTAGFKSDQEFYGLFNQELPGLEKQWTDYTQGALVPTGNPLDLGLSGKGFLALNSPAGTVYTRNGEIQISKSNQLQTSEGYTLRNARDGGKPITIDPSKAIDVSKDGVIRQGGQEIAQIEVAGIDSASQVLNKLGNSYFALLQPAGANPAMDTEIRQGTLEQSNVPVADAAVRLVGVMRQFEMLQKALTVGADMNKQAIEEVAKVS